MSKEDKHIDNLFKEKLDGRSFDGPPADFLADLNQRLDEKEKSSLAFIWIFFLNTIIIALFLANAFFDFSVEQHSENISSDKKKSVKTESLEQDKNDGDNNIQSKNELINNNAENKYDSSGNENNSKSKSDQDNNIPSLNEDPQTSKSPNNQIPREQDGNLSTKENDVEKETNDSGQNQPTKKLSAKSTNDSKTEKEETKRNQNSTSENEKENSVKEINNELDKELIASNYQSIYAADYENVDEVFKSKRIPTVIKVKSSVDSSLTQTEEKEVEENTPQTNRDPLKLELQLFGGASKWGFNTFSTNEGFKDKLDLNSKSLWTPTFGLNVNSYYKDITFGTGVSFLSIKEENIFESFDVSTYDSTYLAGYNENVTYDSLGNPIDTTYTPYYDSTTVTDTSFTNSIIQNQYSWIQIPINIGYRFQLNKWAIIPRLGMNIGIGINNSDVRYPDENYDQIVAGPPVKWNLSLQPSLEIRRDFGNWHAYTRLDYRRNITPTVEYDWFDRRYQGGMVRLGVGYTFEFERGK